MAPPGWQVAERALPLLGGARGPAAVTVSAGGGAGRAHLAHRGGGAAPWEADLPPSPSRVSELMDAVLGAQTPLGAACLSHVCVRLVPPLVPVSAENQDRM